MKPLLSLDFLPELDLNMWFFLLREHRGKHRMEQLRSVSKYIQRCIQILLDCFLCKLD